VIFKKNSLNNQFQDLFEEHNYSYETITDDKIELRRHLQNLEIALIEETLEKKIAR
tara:strand:- start:599 stop:766 length:168 start_codon:yes stop_codon:yes gene_type:complete